MIFAVESKKTSFHFEETSIESWGRSNGFCYGPYTPYLYKILVFLKDLSSTPHIKDLKQLRFGFHGLLANFCDKFEQLVSLPAIANSLNLIGKEEFKRIVSSTNKRKKLYREMKLYRNSMRLFFSSFEQKFGYPLETNQLGFNYPFSNMISNIFYKMISNIFHRSFIKIGPVLYGKKKDILKEVLEVIDRCIKIIEEILFNENCHLNKLEEEINSLLFKEKNKFEEIHVVVHKQLGQIMKLDKTIRDGLFSKAFLNKEEETEVKRAYLLGKIAIIMRIFIFLLWKRIPREREPFPYESILGEELKKFYLIKCNCNCFTWRNKIKRSIPTDKKEELIRDMSTGKYIKLPLYIWDLLGPCIPCSYIDFMHAYKWKNVIEEFKLNRHNMAIHT